METLVIEPSTKSDARFLRSVSKRIGANIIDTDELFWNKVRSRLKEENLLDPDVSESKVIEDLKDFSIKRGLSTRIIDIDELLEEYEDMVFGRMMEERINEPSESMEDVMEFLRQR